MSLSSFDVSVCLSRSVTLAYVRHSSIILVFSYQVSRRHYAGVVCETLRI